MFSVLMSIYYKESPVHFDECMKSIWDDQLLRPSEIILVEDGPLTPSLYDEIKRWKMKLDGTLKIISLKQNVGTGKAKNIGLNQCQFELVCIVDTDDISLPNRFKCQIEFLMENKDVAIVGGQIIEFVDSIDNHTGIRSVPETNEQLIQYSKRRSPFNNMTIAYRKSLIIDVGGYQHHLWMEDYNLFLRVIAKGYKIHNLKDTLVYARIDNGMHGRRKGIQYIKSEKQLLDLKKKLKLQSPLYANMLFLARASFRLLPASMLGKIYNTFLRKKV